MQDFTRLFDIVPYQLTNFPQKEAISSKVNGKWKTLTTEVFLDQINKASRSFLAAGMNPGDKVALISNNRTEWNIVDNGMMQVGVINVPIYPTISEADYKFIFNQAEIKIAFVSSEELFRKISNIKDQVPSLQEIYSFDHVDGCKHFDEFLKLGVDVDHTRVVDIATEIKPDDLATIIYTSGTTGLPKGVMLSHNNVVSNIKCVIPLLPLGPNRRTISFLPLCHIFERVVSYTYFATGTSMYYAESIETIGEDIKAVKPHFFSCVPRLLEKIYDKIIQKGMDAGFPKKQIFFWALEMGLNYKPGDENGFMFKIADKLVFSKWREALGGEIIGIVTGAAALQERLARVFSAAGIAIREGYGQTETSPVISFNRFEKGNYEFGSVGLVIPDVELQFMDREGNMSDNGPGEIIIKGPNVMMGYYQNQEATDKTIKNGWLHTGDVGKLEGKFLHITDRVKDLFKTSGGKYVAPQVIEEKMKESRFIEQLCVIGENQKFVSALIVPSFENIKGWMEHKEMSPEEPSRMIQNEKVIDLLNREIQDLNQSLGHIEQIKKFELLPIEWTVDGGQLTPTMKVKRKIIKEMYAEQIEKIYDV